MALLPGDLQLGVHMRPFEANHEQEDLVPRMWACPRCGYVELVAEQHPATQHAHTADSAETSNGLPHLPVSPEVAAPSSALLDSPVVWEQETTLDPTPPSELAAIELDAAAGAENDEPLPPSEPRVYESAVLASVDAVDIELDAEQADLAGSEDELLAGAEVSRQTIELPSLPSYEQDEPVLGSELGKPGQDALPQTIELPMLPSQQQEEPALASEIGAPGRDDLAEMGGEQLPEQIGAVASPDTHTPAELAGLLPDTASATTQNGTAPKINSRSGRGSRRQPPAADSASPQPPKRRSSGSKRKNTP
jgi:hypothetical protein